MVLEYETHLGIKNRPLNPVGSVEENAQEKVPPEESPGYWYRVTGKVTIDGLKVDLERDIHLTYDCAKDPLHKLVVEEALIQPMISMFDEIRGDRNGRLIKIGYQHIPDPRVRKDE